MRRDSALVCISLILVLAIGCGDPAGDGDVGVPDDPRALGEPTTDQSPVERLQGKFVADKDSTMEYLKSTGIYSDAEVKVLGNIFGMAEITFAGDKRITRVADQEFETTFKVVESGDGYVVIESERSADEEPKIAGGSIVNRIEFTDDGFWLILVGRDGVKEKYVRK